MPAAEAALFIVHRRNYFVLFSRFALDSPRVVGLSSFIISSVCPPSGKYNISCLLVMNSPRAIRRRIIRQEDDEAEQRTFEAARQATPQRASKNFKRRQCRICLEKVKPIVEAFDPFGWIVRVRYVSENPRMDPLISPCVCKGSQKYVHAHCLRMWRWGFPNQENYWKCPTCKFRYDLDRLDYAAWIKFQGVQMVLVSLIFAAGLFILGFFGNFLMRLYFDPFGTFWDAVYESTERILGSSSGSRLVGVPTPMEQNDASWSYHFIKGLAALGIVGAYGIVYKHGWRVLFYNGGGFGRGKRSFYRGGRLEAVNWTVISFGAVIFIGVSCPHLRSLISCILTLFSKLTCGWRIRLHLSSRSLLNTCSTSKMNPCRMGKTRMTNREK